MYIDIFGLFLCFYLLNYFYIFFLFFCFFGLIVFFVVFLPHSILSPSRLEFISTIYIHLLVMCLFNFQKPKLIKLLDSPHEKYKKFRMFCFQWFFLPSYIFNCYTASFSCFSFTLQIRLCCLCFMNLIFI